MDAGHRARGHRGRSRARLRQDNGAEPGAARPARCASSALGRPVVRRPVAQALPGRRHRAAGGARDARRRAAACALAWERGRPHLPRARRPAAPREALRRGARPSIPDLSPHERDRTAERPPYRAALIVVPRRAARLPREPRAHGDLLGRGRIHRRHEDPRHSAPAGHAALRADGPRLGHAGADRRVGVPHQPAERGRSAPRRRGCGSSWCTSRCRARRAPESGATASDCRCGGGGDSRRVRVHQLAELERDRGLRRRARSSSRSSRWLALRWRAARGTRRAPRVPAAHRLPRRRCRSANHLLALLVGPGGDRLPRRTRSAASRRPIRSSAGMSGPSSRSMAGIWALLIGTGLGSIGLLLLGVPCSSRPPRLFAAPAGAGGFAAVALLLAAVGVSPYLFLLHPLGAAPDAQRGGTRHLGCAARRDPARAVPPAHAARRPHRGARAGEPRPQPRRSSGCRSRTTSCTGVWQWARAACSRCRRVVLRGHSSASGVRGSLVQRRRDRGAWWLLLAAVAGDRAPGSWPT